MKRAWHDQLAEPFSWLLYAFFQPRRLERELSTGGVRQRLSIMLRMIVPMVLVAYPISVLGHVVLLPFHLVLHPEIIRGILLDSVLGIAVGITSGIMFGIVFGIASGIAVGIAVGIVDIFTFGIAFGIAAGITVGIADIFTFGIAFGIAVGIAGSFTFGIAVVTTVGIAVGIADSFTYGITVGIVFIICCLIGFFRLPFYLVSGPSTLKAYLNSRRDPVRVFEYLHRCSLYWDEIVYLPLPYLKQTLLTAYDQDSQTALETIAFIAVERPRQLHAARLASLEIALCYLEECKEMSEIAEAARRLDDIFPQETKLLDPQWATPITRMQKASRDAQRFSSPIGRRPKLDALDDMMKQLKGVHSNVAFRDARLNARLGRVVDTWLTLAQRKQEELEQVPVYIGSIDNPYNPSYPLKPEDSLFQGRRDLAQVLESELMKGDRRPTFLLASERRMGKSSALLQLPCLLGSRFLPIFYDLQSPGIFANTPTFLGTLAEGIYKEMRVHNLPIEKLVYKTLRDYSTQQVASQTMLETIVVSHAQSSRYEISPYTAYSIFDGWLRNVEAVLEKEGSTLLLMLDEYEKLEEAGQKGTFELSLLLDWFRNIIQYHPRVALLFSGIHTFDEMGESEGLNWSGHFVNVQTLHVGSLHKEEARHLITKPTPNFSDEDIYGDGVVESILDKTGCHPFLVQAVCYALINNLNAKKKECASIKDVDEAIEPLFEHWSNYFRDLWNRTDVHQRACILALHKLEAADGERLQQESGLKEHVVWRTLDTLLKRGLVKQVDGMYTISTPIFSQWAERSRRL